MESPSPKQQFSPTKTPLFPASPERMNQQRLAGSTSMPLDLNQKSSDVREKIAFLNNLSRAGSPAASPVHATSSNVSSSSAALQRAILGREEAESALTNANNLLKDAQARERRISERLESLLEELQTTRERQAHERAVFEKEVRKARKEAFRAGSMLVKVQEELKLAKGEVKTLKEEVRAEKESKEKAKQEAFERAYALAGITEEAQSLKDQLRALESNNQQNLLESRVDGLNESISRSTVEYTDQATYTTPSPRRPKRSVDALELLKDIQSNEEQNSQSEGTPTKKLRLAGRVSDIKNIQSDSLEYHLGIISDLRAEIQLEQRRRAKAEDMVFFMKMECQFKRCSCRIAENLGQKYIHDKEWAEHHQEENSEQEEDEIPEEAKPETLEQDVREQTPSTSAAHSPLVSPVTAMTPPTPHYQDLNDEHKPERPARQSSVAYCRESGTFVQVSSPHAYMHDRPSEGPLVLPNADDEDDVTDSSENLVERANPMEEHAEIITSQYPANEPCIETENHEPEPTNTFTRNHKLPSHPSYERVPITPVEQTTAINEEHITKTVPIRIESRHPRNPADIIPGTPLTREEALAQIRARRGRTKSGTQRSVSANEATARGGAGPTTTGGPARRIPGVKSSETRSEMDVKERRGTAPVVSRRY